MSDVNPRSKVEFVIKSDANPKLMDELSVKRITLVESLLSPSLQTTVFVQNYRHLGYVKNLDEYANTELTIRIRRPILRDFGYNDELLVKNRVWRIDERNPFNYQIDEFALVASDETVLKNANRRMSKSWKCVPPHIIAADALKGCVGVNKLIIEAAAPTRTYFAENLHPYQVVAQQADVALANGNDPSFLHFITYEDIVGTHRFESLYGMTRKNHIAEFTYVEAGDTNLLWENPFSIHHYEFPCDFDIISDLMNGIDKGVDNNSLLVINPFNGIHSILGGNNAQCGMGGSEGDTSFTNQGSASAEGNCEIDVERHKLKRTARLSLLDTDKVSLRMTVGFNPNLHVGKMIKATFPNKIVNDNGDFVEIKEDYGSGYYLISALTHNIEMGGYATTVIDCLTKAVGNGGKTLG